MKKKPTKPTICLARNEWDEVTQIINLWSSFTESQVKWLNSKKDKTFEEKILLEKYIDYNNQVSCLIMRLELTNMHGESTNEDLNLEA